MPSDTSQPWYAVKVRARGEGLVKTVLAGKGYTTYLPTYREARQYSDRIKTVDNACFPGYLFCRLDIEHRLPILTTPGVEYIVGCDRVPEAIPDEELEAIRRVLGTGAAAKPWPYLRAGHRVRVMFGSFSGVEGILMAEKTVDRLILSINMLQRSVAIEIDRSWILPV
jgi:transcription antitermination factor NusG